LWFGIERSELGFHSLTKIKESDLTDFARLSGQIGSRLDHPPLNAEFLFYLFMKPKDCDAIVGDLEERYRSIRKKFGVRRANFWYWSQTIRSVGPIVWQWLTKLALKPVLATSTWLITHGLLKDGSVLEFVKNILAELTKRIRGYPIRRFFLCGLFRESP
jgi:hypothetical protein